MREGTEVLPVDAAVEWAGTLAIRYQLSHCDALIIASALLAACEMLYSEDLQHKIHRVIRILRWDTLQTEVLYHANFFDREPSR